jgi:cation:H+ antiporter
MLKLIGLNLDVNTHWALLVLAVIIGFVLIIFGGNFFVDSSIWISKKAKISPLIIGATVVSIGTTLPELVVSVIAAIEGNAAVALGNSTGSPLFNELIILGVVLAFSVVLVKIKDYAPKAIILFFSAVVLCIFVMINKNLSMLEGILLLVLFCVFLAYNICDALRHPDLPVVLSEKSNNPQLNAAFGSEKEAESSENSTNHSFNQQIVSSSQDSELLAKSPLEKSESASKNNKNEKAKDSVFFNLAMFVVGAAAIAFGASALVDGVTAIAKLIGISEQVIAITVVAVGTSLPELVTGITSLRKKTAALSIGNIIGANIINITLISGLSAVIVSAKNSGGAMIAASDYIGFLLAVGLITLGLLVIFIPMFIKKRTYKWQGYTLLGIYAAYLVYLIASGAV